MTLNLKIERGQRTFDVQLGENATVAELKQKIYDNTKSKKMVPERQRLALPVKPGTTDKDGKPVRPAALVDEKKLSDYSINNGDTLLLKDLGPQIGWTTVFFWEYFGPLICYAFLFLRPSFVYGLGASSKPYSDVVRIALFCWWGHYAKRILETFFVHRFSKGTMPLFNLFKNCSYYWGFALYVAYFVNHPLYTPPGDITFSLGGSPITIRGSTRIVAGLTMFLVCELLNFITHIQLRNLRPAGTRIRRVPRGILFSYMSCPNYLFEILSWVGFTLMTQTMAGFLFMVAGAGQMAIWAAGKHRNYRKEFTGLNGTERYPRSRKALIPFLF